MRTLVLDCSAALALVLPDEFSGAVQDALVGSASQRTRVLVPAFWWYECTNVLLQAVRRERIQLSQAREALGLLSRLPSQTRDAASLVDAVHLMHLSTRLKLSAYDAAYLALAEVSGGVLVSLDRKLCDAAHSIGILNAL